MLIIFDLDNALFDRLGQVPSDYTPDHINKITLFPGARKFLEEVNAKKILLTKETDKDLQNWKIDVLKIRDLFDEVIICYENHEKRGIIQDIVRRFPEEKIWVYGDRIDSEIRYGNEFGCETIKMHSGPWKDLKPKDELEVPNHTIYKFEDIRTIIK